MDVRKVICAIDTVAAGHEDACRCPSCRWAKEANRQALQEIIVGLDTAERAVREQAQESEG